MASEERGTIRHSIYILMKDTGSDAVERQLQLGRRLLTGHPGQIGFSAAVLATGLVRHQQVPYLQNYTAFTVSFHFVWENAAAHDEYQTSDRHRQFIAQSNSNWERLIVLDSVTADGVGSSVLY